MVRGASAAADTAATKAQLIMKIALTGIKPTGTPHLGNYLGAIRPALELVRHYRAFYFIADYHALTTVKNNALLKRLTHEVAATWLALGLNPTEAVFCRQSDIPEVFELTWILGCCTPKGFLNRSHAYKAAVDQNAEAGRDADDQINAGLFNYPVLMAADILLFGTEVVPVGADQKQHLEITRDIALSFNKTFGEIFTVPEALISEATATLPGIDGRKMSKNYENTIPLFLPPRDLRKRVMRIVTDSKAPAESKDPDQCNVFSIYRHFADADAIERTRRRYFSGGLAYSDTKEELFELLEKRFSEGRRRYNDFLKHPQTIDQYLKEGAERARAVAQPMMERVRSAIGAGPFMD